MRGLASALERAGFRVANVGYPSRMHPIEALASIALERGLAACANAGRIHVVAHSLGGILVRVYLARHRLDRLHRVVMLGAPNQGSEVVDRLRNVPGFRLINGPAGTELGTGADSIPQRLGPVDFELGIIAGSRPVNPLLSLFFGEANDGKVSVERTKVKGMSDFMVVPHSHSFLMHSKEVIAQTVQFIQTGRFAHDRRSVRS